MKKPVTNIQVEVHGMAARYTLSCEYDGARYHIWFGANRQPEEILYKNPLHSVKPNEPGYYRARYLDPKKKFGAALFSRMMEFATANNLFDLADAHAVEVEKEEKARAAKAYQRKLQCDAGPELYEALERLYKLAEIAQWPAEDMEAASLALRHARGEQ